MPAPHDQSIASNLSDPAALLARQLARQLVSQAEASRQRRCLLLAGEQGWCRQQAVGILRGWQPQPLLWVAHDAPDGSWRVSAGDARQLIGQQLQALVFDAWDGFDPDAFGATTGTLQGGGLLLLLTPPLAEWPGYADPEHARIVTAPTGPDQGNGRYLKRLARIVAADPHTIILRQHQPLPALPPLPADLAAADIDYADQGAAVAAVVRVATGHRRRPVVLTADRGRGKSAALGIAAAELLQQGIQSIAVTGPRLASVGAVFEHCARLLPAAKHPPGIIELPGGSLRFVAPDQLLAEPRSLDLLLIDEAAALPTALLQRLLKQYNRIAFATTVHGYEGSGRGFALRFNHALDRGTRGWHKLQLKTPMRWAADDPLEALCFRSLMLDAEATADAIAGSATPTTCSVEAVDRDQLVDDEAMLRELFGLLVLAHYRTRPYDLRQLLDGSNVSVLALRHRGHVVGTALLAAEGGLDATTCSDIWAGRRRPHGHLLPEALSAHLGLQQAPALHSQRIMRIAIHPAARRRGLGLQLLQAIAGYARKQGMDYLGSSFGATPELLGFWQQAGYRPVRISTRASAASGSHSAIMLQGISEVGTRLCELAGERFQAHLPAELGDHLQALDVDLALQLLGNRPPRPRLEHQDWLDLLAFSCARRDYEACIVPIAALSRFALAESNAPLQLDQRRLLLARVVQRRGWAEVAALSRLSGRAQVVSGLRAALRALLLHYAPADIREQALTLIETDRSKPRLPG